MFSFHLHLFLIGSVGMSIPKEGMNIRTVCQRYLYVVVFWKCYLTYEIIWYLREGFSYLCETVRFIHADDGIDVKFWVDTIFILLRTEHTTICMEFLGILWEGIPEHQTRCNYYQVLDSSVGTAQDAYS